MGDAASFGSYRVGAETAQRETEGRGALTVTVWAVIIHPSFA